jgi:hypothetical protein
MAADVVEPLILREGAVTTVVTDHKETPHKKSCEREGGRKGGREGGKEEAGTG